MSRHVDLLFLQVFRHLDQGQAHKFAIEFERSLPANERLSGIVFPSTSSTKANDTTPIAGTPRTFSQRNVSSMFLDSSKDAFQKLTRTAYELAMNPTLSLNQFTTLVKVQRQNGVRLVKGKPFLNCSILCS